MQESGIHTDYEEFPAMLETSLENEILERALVQRDGRRECPRCPKSYTRGDKLRAHMLKHHALKVTCYANKRTPANQSKKEIFYGSCSKVLNESATNPDTSRNHSLNDSSWPILDVQSFKETYINEDGRYFCHQCDVSYKRSGKLREHMLNKHNSKLPRLLMLTAPPKDILNETPLQTSGNSNAPKLRSHSGSKVLQESVTISNRSVNCKEDDSEEPVYDDSLAETNSSIESSEDEEISERDLIKQDGRFQCPKCPNSYTRAEKLRAHMLKYHSIKVTGHVNKRVPDMQPKVEILSDSCSSKVVDFSATNSNNSGNCSLVDFGWPSQDIDGLTETESGVEDEILEQELIKRDGRHECPKCPKSYTRGEKLRAHMLKHHAITVTRHAKTNDSGNVNYSDWPILDLESFQETYMNKDGRYFCPHCDSDVSYKRLGNLREHMMTKHYIKLPRLLKLTKKSKDNICNPPTAPHETSANSTGSKPGSHSDSGGLEVSVKNNCSLTDWPILDTHSFTEMYMDKDNRYFCHNCDRSYKRSSKLREHMLSAHNTKLPRLINVSSRPNQNINQTPSSSGNSGKLKLRARVMKSQNEAIKKFSRSFKARTQDQQPGYICDQCGKSFKLMSSMKLHLRRAHSGDKEPGLLISISQPFQENGRKRRWYTCPECGLLCSRTNRLRYHMASVHDMQLPFKGKCRSNSNDRLGDVWDLRPHKCEKCGKSFTTQQHRRRHMQNVHKIPPEVIQDSSNSLNQDNL